jgi:putative heme-binding domain-containing protein
MSSITSRSFVAVAVSWVMLALVGPFLAASAAENDAAKRAPWTTSRITGSPEPPLPYTTERAFPTLKFTQCLDVVAAPGSDRLFVVEQEGKIFSFPDRPDINSADMVVDLAKEIPSVKSTYALAFHPDFAKNRYCYVCYIKAENLPDGSHIARFRMTDTDPPTIDVASETTIITWLSGGHNGCCLKFGLDGYLYISTGDGSGPNPPDALRAGQDVTNLLSAILRIDVDHAEGGRNYRIPPDNPLIDYAGARPEIWAYGFRNPWRMSIDRKTGDLWVGDVGWELWELLDRVERGGNYGWSVVEGRQPTNPEWPRGPTPILPPTIEHPHSESSSITDGLTYYGQRLKELHGTHIYGDYDTGKIWGFRYENGRIVDHRELADTTHRIVGFGEDRRGEFYLLDHTAGTIHRLVPNPRRETRGIFPRKLSGSGLYALTADHTPATGVISYSINAEMWADHAVAERLIAVPGDSSVKVAADPNVAWLFPTDSVLVKTLSLDMEQGNPASRRRIETQLLHFDGQEWQPYTYQWNEEQTDAVLLDAAGAERTFDVEDAGAPGGKRRQSWRFSGRAECQRCHNKWSGPPLAFNLPQLTPNHGGNSKRSQLDELARLGLVDEPKAAANRPGLTNPRDASADLSDRARSYLHANCAHCHRLHAGSAVLSKMPFDVPLEKTDMIGVRPTQGTFNIHAAQVIAPGDPLRSVLYYRVSTLGGGRMPHIGSTEVDREGVDLIHQWIRHMPPSFAKDTVGSEAAARLRSQEADVLARLSEAEKEADQAALVDRLLSSTSGALLLAHSVQERALPPGPSALAIHKAAQHEGGTVRDLFERFLPSEQRVKRLGSIVRPEQILELPGDAAAGKRLFFETASVSCKNCHRIGDSGKEVGPELTTIGKKYDRSQLLESILEPSKRIDPKYVTHLVETDEGRVVSGLLVKKSDAEVVLKDAQDMEIRISAAQIEKFVPQGQSLMPDLLVRDMTAQQVADLLAYLSSLK